MRKESATELIRAYVLARTVHSKISFSRNGGSDYPDEVLAFFDVIASSDWLDRDYESGREMKKLRDALYLSSATSAELSSILTAVWRGERYFDGLWSDVFRGGHLERVISRLAKIFNLEPLLSE